MTRTRYLIQTFVLLSVSAVAAGQSTIYRCKMVDGTTVFSDTPCLDQSSDHGTQDELEMVDYRNALESRPRLETRPQFQTPRGKSQPRAAPPVEQPSYRSVIESTVIDAFEGWEGETLVRLDNGQIWLQDEYHYEYQYQYRPKAIIFSSNGRWKMQIEGMGKPVAVELIRN